MNSCSFKTNDELNSSRTFLEARATPRPGAGRDRGGSGGIGGIREVECTRTRPIRPLAPLRARCPIEPGGVDVTAARAVGSSCGPSGWGRRSLEAQERHRPHRERILQGHAWPLATAERSATVRGRWRLPLRARTIIAMGRRPDRRRGSSRRMEDRVGREDRARVAVVVTAGERGRGDRRRRRIQHRPLAHPRRRRRRGGQGLLGAVRAIRPGASARVRSRHVVRLVQEGRPARLAQRPGVAEQDQVVRPFASRMPAIGAGRAGREASHRQEGEGHSDEAELQATRCAGRLHASQGSVR